MFRRTLILALLAAGAAAVPSPADVALAQGRVCAAAPVTAPGEPARYQWLARTKARANWRARVRSMASLGGRYANWARASGAVERCLSGPAGTVCILTAVPCRS